jgi:chromosome segregation ATPase
LIKWTALGLAGSAAAAFFVFGEHTGSYLGTVASSMRESVRGKIPVEFELKRAERLVGEIDPQIENCRRDVARAEVELADLEQQIEDLSVAVSRDERKLKAGREVLATASVQQPVYELAGKRYDRQRVELDLARTLETHKSNVTILRGKRALRERQTQAVDAARTRLDAVRSQKTRLEDQIATLKLQKRQQDAMAATSSRFDLDDSALSKAKEVLSRVKKELDIAQRVIEDDLFHSQGIATELPAGVDVVKEIDTFFAEEAGSVAMPPAKLELRAAAPVVVEVR